MQTITGSFSGIIHFFLNYYSLYSDGPSVNLRQLFNSNITKVSVIKWSQNCTRTIRHGVVGIPKYLKKTCRAGYFNILAMPKTRLLRVLLVHF